MADSWLSAGVPPDFAEFEGKRSYRPRHAAPTFWRLMPARHRAHPRIRLTSAGHPDADDHRDAGDQRDEGGRAGGVGQA